MYLKCIKKLKKVLELLIRPAVKIIDIAMQPPESENTQPQNTQTVQSGSWYLVSLRSKKREVFLKYLKLAIAQNKLQDLILAVEIPSASVYEDFILLNLSNFKAACTHLQKIENFQSIERKPLNTEQMSRMLGVM